MPLAICETKHGMAKYWISIKTMKKMGEERKQKKREKPAKAAAFYFIAATTRIMYGHIGCVFLT